MCVLEEGRGIHLKVFDNDMEGIVHTQVLRKVLIPK